MYRLLIADKSEVFCKALAEQTRGMFEIAICRDGVRAVEMVQRFRPDAMVIDLALPGLDGIGVLRTIRTAGFCPRVLATSAEISDYVLNMLQKLSVSYYIRKPCTVLNVTARLYEMMNSAQSSGDESWNLRDEAFHLLLSLGVSLCGKNFACIHEGLVCMTENRTRFVTKELYPIVASRCGGSSKRVEKAIRDAIEKAWLNRDDRVWQLYFATGRDGTVECPTNGEFFARLAYYLERSRKVG